MRQIDNYRLIQLLGEGSFGEVYLAEHVHRRTQFAVKILRARLSSATMNDFLNEARVFRLEHPNIIRIRDFGVERDIPFLVMDYVAGGTLRQRHPAGTRLAVRTVVLYVKQISAALQYAHEDGLVHRDVKPENMLAGPNDDILLSDFGIVTASYTWNPGNVQGVAGTALYMAPEQIQGKPVRASDQYALAAIVYEWLVGFPPFQGTPTELTVQHLAAAPPAPRIHVPTIPIEVEQTVLRGLAKDPRKRFASVLEFAESLERASKPRGGTTLYTFSGHTDLVTAVAYSPDGAAIASASNDTTVQIWDAEQESVLCTYHGHTRAVTALAWSPDGTRIASASSDRTVQVWEASTGNRLHTYRLHSDDVLAVSWSPDGTRIASASCDRTIHIWEAATANKLRIYRHHTDDVCVVAWSPDSKYIASASYDTTVLVREVATGITRLSYHNHQGGIYAVAWSPDSKFIASASYDQTVQVREVANGTLLLTYLGHSDGVFAVAWSPDGKHIASGGDDQTVQVWRYDTGHILTTYPSPASGVRTIAWSPDGQHIASGGGDQTVYVWQAL